MPARSVCPVALSPSEARPGRFGGQVSVTDIYHAMPCHAYSLLVVSGQKEIRIRRPHAPGLTNEGARGQSTQNRPLLTDDIPIVRAAQVFVRVRSRMAWYGMVEVCEGAPVVVSGWVLADGHDLRPCAASSLHRGTMSVSDVIGGTRTLGMAQASN